MKRVWDQWRPNMILGLRGGCKQAVGLGPFL